MQTLSALQAMGIIARMEAALAGEGNMVMFSLKQAIEQKKPANMIIKFTQEMINDNEKAIQSLLGISLTKTIKNHNF